MKKNQKEFLTTYSRIAQLLHIDRKTIYNRLKKNCETIKRDLLSEANQRIVFFVLRVPYEEFFSNKGDE
jgi:hypothetical protein